MTILERAVKCMDAGVDAGGVDFISNSDIRHDVEELINDFKEKYEIRGTISNAEIWDSNDYSEAMKEADNLELAIFKVCWEFMKTMMLDCGAGEVVNEVLTSEITGVAPSWERGN